MNRVNDANEPAVECIVLPSGSAVNVRRLSAHEAIELSAFAAAYAGLESPSALEAEEASDFLVSVFRKIAPQLCVSAIAGPRELSLKRFGEQDRIAILLFAMGIPVEAEPKPPAKEWRM